MSSYDKWMKELTLKHNIKLTGEQGVCVCVCVCVREREREKEREREREREKNV